MVKDSLDPLLLFPVPCIGSRVKSIHGPFLSEAPIVEGGKEVPSFSTSSLAIPRLGFGHYVLLLGVAAAAAGAATLAAT